MNLQKFKILTARQRALVAIAVLLDGREAMSYLEASSDGTDELRLVAGDLARIAPELRMPLVGTLLRMALKELGR